ncbi:MAG: type II toxin-antitoxin system RelE/ParE family toxin [Nostoc sp. DedVER02]|uniref:type II toxin-antitoxin system RelE/ParE family toxin n=1 Tax=unclassified Nostoc TaxID=2593658 RepID=UPI002AD36292|nr:MULTISPECIES: type II toxin-antitoxin system RelE/ParE family toxin [unclassified Nostoc]MDZ7989567.1 type II toxin-antitoxin system RelE/ParE family toxin [Nostoc sp. DedVER02]MDZ8116106.1 type II toxin-antitoxin system RelE/ParE family toxin [Nostoc sp. DedVER01b]
MPETRIIFYQDQDGMVPVLEWLKTLLKQDRKGYANCVARIQQLASTGYELRRPAADYLRDGIYELRAKHVRVQYRILYFFSGQNVAILTHAIAKDEDRVPDIEIERTIQRKAQFEANPAVHTYVEETENGEDE